MWAELVAAREVRQKGWCRASSTGDDSYVAFVNEASSVLDHTLDYVPGLLQVPANSRALFAASIGRRTRESVEPRWRCGRSAGSGSPPSRTR